jgi:hypothetical protein
MQDEADSFTLDGMGAPDNRRRLMAPTAHLSRSFCIAYRQQGRESMDSLYTCVLLALGGALDRDAL